MANRWMQQFFFSLEHNPVFIDGQFTVGSSGAVSAVQGSGIQGVTKLATGVYRIELEDQYFKFLGADIRCLSGITGGNVTDGSFNSGTTYQITALGTTDWNAIGLLTGATAAVGDVFTATGAGGSGAGTAKVVSVSGIAACEVIQDPNPSIKDQKKPYLIFQTLAPVSGGTVAAPVLTMDSYTPAGVITNGTPDTFAGTPAVLTGTNTAPAFTGSAAVMTKAHPASGSIIRFNIVLRNSSLKGKGE